MTSLLEKDILHPTSRYRGRYDLAQLIKVTPELSTFLIRNKYGGESIDFSHPQAVKILNKALLKYFYHVSWDIPDGYLCPPVPGRADYIHYIADLIGHSRTKPIRILDIGVGANCIYPIIGYKEYGWTFLGSEIDPIALKSAQSIVEQNDLSKMIELKLQRDPMHIFQGILEGNEKVDVSLCNPPFHTSLKEATLGTRRKWNNLKKTKESLLNFGGQVNELVCVGGEIGFVKRMIQESIQVKDKCTWFTTLISKEKNLPVIYEELKKIQALHVKTINMAQGQKKSRIVAWSFFSHPDIV